MFNSYGKSIEMLRARIEVLEGALKQKDELISYWKGRVDKALEIQNIAEQRQMEAFDKFTKCMDMLTELKGYKDAVKDMVKTLERQK